MMRKFLICLLALVWPTLLFANTLQGYFDKGEAAYNNGDYMEAINYYEHTGKQLASELIRSSQKSYMAGEIDFFRFAQSVDSAVEIELNHLENLHQHNQLVLEINFMTLAY